MVIPPSAQGLEGEGWYRLSLIFTNHGAVACAISGIPSAQPVVGAKHRPVGGESNFGPVPRWTGAPVILAARKGSTYVRYSMRIPTPNYPMFHGCLPKTTDGVVITFRSETKVLLTGFFRIAKYPVCTDDQSTTIEGEQLRPLWASVDNPLGCTTVWMSITSLWPEYQGQTVDAALQASAAGFSKFGPVVFEKMTGSDFMPGEARMFNPWYLVFTKNGHKGLGLIDIDSRPDGFTYARLGPYCK
ncbi:hypothetical protein GALL_516370 [mine drainage metagenome]|uniref:Uncharacterized protein n=1 Tax=mine drainage metagenome TaxID=410659 RepID=A0A1J5PG48_9ZZZZ